MVDNKLAGWEVREQGLAIPSRSDRPQTKSRGRRLPCGQLGLKWVVFSEEEENNVRTLLDVGRNI